MLIDGSAIVAILARRPGSDALLKQLDAAAGPFLTTPLALVAAMDDLARLKAGGTAATPALLAGARDAVVEFATALGLREVPVSADLGRRAADLLAAGGGTVGRCFSAAAAPAYRVPLLAWDLLG